MNRRKNRMDLLFQITERLQELTGEQNVWKAIDKLQGGIKEERAENLKAITTIMKLVNRSNDRLRHKLKKRQEYDRMHGVEEGIKQERKQNVAEIKHLKTTIENLEMSVKSFTDSNVDLVDNERRRILAKLREVVTDGQFAFLRDCIEKEI